MSGLRSIRTRTFALFVIPSFVLIMIGAMLGYQRVADRAISTATSEATSAAAATAADFSARLGRLAQQASATAAHVSLQEVLPDDQELFELLESNVRSEPLVYGSAFGFAPGVLDSRQRFAPYVFDGPEGIQRIDIAVDAYDYTRPEWEWYAGPAADGAARWTAPYFDTDAGGIVMVTYSAPLRIGGEFGGVATVDVPMSALPSQLTVDIPANLRLIVLDTRTNVVWDSQSEVDREPVPVAELSPQGASQAWVPQVMSRTPGAIDLPDGVLGGSSQTALYAPINDTPWHLVAVLDRGAILTEVRREAFVWSGAGLVGFLILGLVAWRAADSSTRRMRDLAMQASALAAGDYDVRVDENEDELGEVARALNRLGEQLADRAAAAKAAQQRRFGDLVETSPRGTLLLGSDHDVSYANTAAMALLSPSGNALEGRPLTAMIGPDDLPTIIAQLPTISQGDRLSLGQIHLVDDEGTLIPVDASVARVGTDEDVLTVLSFRDLREELRSARILAERERFLAGIFQNAGVGIVVTDPDGTIRDANVTFREYVGRELVELLGHPFADLIHPDDREEGGRVLAALGRGALNGFVTEHRYLRTGGAVSWGEARSAALRDANDEVERVIIAVSDLTSRRRTNATFRAVFEHSDDGYVILRKDRVDDANGAALRLFGVPGVSDLQLPLLGGVHAPDMQPSGLPSEILGEEILKSAWQGTPYRGGEWDVKRLDGSVTTVSLTLVPIQVGEDHALLVVTHDLSQRKQFEAELVEARDEAESAARAKADFLATMSHEIRTPMNGVIGMIDLLAESPLSADQQRMINTTKDSALALLAIINDVLDFSKIEAGKLELEQVPVGIHELGDAVTEMLSTNAANAGLSLQSVVEHDVPDAMIGDPVRLRQILFNLVGNAIKFTTEGGVVIRSSRLAGAEGRDRLRISVEDSGIGMTEEQVGRLFQPFTQAESSTTRRFGGTGLGLSIVARLVELMRGRVSIESEVGAGSTFHVEIPLHEAEWDPGLPDVSDLHIAACSTGSPEHEAFLNTLTRAGARAEVVSSDEIQSRLRQGARAPDVVYLGSSMDPVDRVRVRGMAASEPDTSRVAFVAGLPAGTSTDAPDLPDTTMVVSAPLTRLSLFNAIGVATGRLTPVDEVAPDATQAVTREMAIENGQLLLVAEDNRTNQEVIRRQLQLLGYFADIVGDGKQALEAMDTTDYAALLTDCHMPNVDGFELTRAVRRHEETDASSRLPIIAITANALQGEGARCLAEGMDDYLTKPVEMPRLTASLNRWVGPPATAPGTSAPVPTAASAPPAAAPHASADSDSSVVATEDRVEPGDHLLPVLDITVLETTLRGDRATAHLLLADFVPNARELVDDARAAVDGGDTNELVRVGHTLKSSARAVGAMRLGEACDALEAKARAVAAERLRADVEDLVTLFEQVDAAVQSALDEARAEVVP